MAATGTLFVAALVASQAETAWAATAVTLVVVTLVVVALVIVLIVVPTLVSLIDLVSLLEGLLTLTVEVDATLTVLKSSAGAVLVARANTVAVKRTWTTDHVSSHFLGQATKKEGAE